MITGPGYPLRIERRVFVPMGDGTRIALTLYLPDAAGDGPFPAVVESLPYRKDDDCTARDYSTYAYLAARGIAGVRIDIRGTGASTGVIADEYTSQEQADTLEILDWTAAQEWCSGNLGMWGVSWGGFSSLQTAMLRPSNLKAIAPVHATHDRFACDVHYTGGSLHAAEQVDWPPSMITTNALPPDPDIIGDGWFEEWMERLQNTPQWPAEWLRHQRRDEYWLHGSPCSDYQSIECPTLLIGGWLDGYVDGMLALSEHLQCPTRTVIGPWGHYRPATGVPGPTFDHFELLARWFGHHLRGDDNGVMDMPSLTAYVRTAPPYETSDVSGYWRSEPNWPPLDRETWSVGISELSGNVCDWNGPQWVGSHAPAWDRAGVTSTDPTADDGASMTFTSAPLENTLEILGPPELEVTVTTDLNVGMVAARLLAVSPDGAAHLICRGSRNLAFPDGFDRPKAPTPDEPMTVTVLLPATSAVIPQGWSIRLSLAGADFPVVWPPGRRFTLPIDPKSSVLHLPLVPPREADNTIHLGESPPPITPPVRFLDSSSAWRVEKQEGWARFHKEVASGQIQPDRDQLSYYSHQTWSVEVEDNDPATTKVFSESILGLSRPGWAVETTGTLEITGADVFHVVVELTASHQGRQVFNRRWVDDVPRVWV